MRVAAPSLGEHIGRYTLTELSNEESLRTRGDVNTATDHVCPVGGRGGVWCRDAHRLLISAERSMLTCACTRSAAVPPSASYGKVLRAQSDGGVSRAVPFCSPAALRFPARGPNGRADSGANPGNARTLTQNIYAARSLVPEQMPQSPSTSAARCPESCFGRRRSRPPAPRT